MKVVPSTFVLCLVLACAGKADRDLSEVADDLDQEPISLDALPHAVEAAALEAVPGLVLTRAEREGAQVFCLYGETNDLFYELELTADGQVLELEESGTEEEEERRLPLYRVPRGIREAASNAMPGFVARRAEIEIENGVTVYCLVGTVDGVAYELEVTATEGVLETEVGDD
jgi:hypothetical protein